MSELDLFVVDKSYIDYIQEAETEARGFTKVPNMDYPDGKPKLVCGVVLINIEAGMSYYVGLTSYKRQKSENLLIITKDRHRPIKGSLRFNYMFPVPNGCLSRKVISDEIDWKYRNLLLKEYKFVKDNEELIRTKAKEVYDKINDKENCSKTLLNNSCNFKTLELICNKYVDEVMAK